MVQKKPVNNYFRVLLRATVLKELYFVGRLSVCCVASEKEAAEGLSVCCQ